MPRVKKATSPIVKDAVLRWWGAAITPEGRCIAFVFADEDNILHKIFAPLHAIPGNTTDKILRALGVRAFHGGIEDDGTLLIPKGSLHQQPCKLLFHPTGGIEILSTEAEVVVPAPPDGKPNCVSQ